MDEKKPDGFEIPSFVENKDAIDKSIFQLNGEEKEFVRKDEYIPAHGENTAALRQRVARELNDVLETSNDEETPKVRRPAPNEPQKTPLWIIILSIVAIVTALVAATLFVKDFFSSSPKKTPTPSPSATVAPSPSVVPSPSVSPSLDPNASAKPTSSPAATTSPTATPSTSSSAYVLNASMNVRSGPSAANAIIDSANMPSAYVGSADGSVIREGTTVTVLEVRTSGTAKWGRIGSDAWVCLEDGDQVYAKKK